MKDKIHDLVIIGAGPSALTAAIYTAREDIETILYEKAVVGGMAAITDRIDNYPGFPDGIDGFELTDRMQKQAKKFGTKIEAGHVTALHNEDGIKVLTIDSKEVKAKAVLISTGSDYNKIGIPGEAEYYGRGVHYCATCDGAFYRGKTIAVVGGGNSAVQEAIYLTRFADSIHLLVRSTVKASDVLQKELQQMVDDGKIMIHVGTTTDEIIANDNKVSSVKVTKDGKTDLIEIDGVFIFAGLKPNTQFLVGSGIELDEIGFVKTDCNLQTNITGVYCSGDVRSGSTMQIASAVGEGATAALEIREYLSRF
jgi:thioredoxin reductase (NADPH)